MLDRWGQSCAGHGVVGQAGHRGCQTEIESSCSSISSSHSARWDAEGLGGAALALGPPSAGLGEVSATAGGMGEVVTIFWRKRIR